MYLLGRGIYSSYSTCTHAWSNSFDITGNSCFRESIRIFRNPCSYFFGLLIVKILHFVMFLYYRSVHSHYIFSALGLKTKSCDCQCSSLRYLRCISQRLTRKISSALLSRAAMNKLLTSNRKYFYSSDIQRTKERSG